MADGGDDLFVTGGGVEKNKSIIGFVLIVGVDRFGKTGKIAVGSERVCFADADGGVFSVNRAFSNKIDILIGIFFVEFR